MNVELLKETYFRELDGKVQLDSRWTIFVAVLSAVGTIIAFLIRSAWSTVGPLQIPSIVFTIVSILISAIAVLCSFKANLGYTYQRLPLADVLLEYSNNLETYYSKNPQVAGSPKDEFEIYLCDHLADAASRNAWNNIKRSAYYYRSSWLIFYSIVSSGAAGLCIVLNPIILLLIGNGP